MPHQLVLNRAILINSLLQSEFGRRILLPKIFIASSSSAKQVAYDIEELLADDARCNVWVRSFRPSKGTLETLLEWLDEADFGIFIFFPDDLLVSKESAILTTRDNVVFEAGLFIGRIGISRNFIFRPSGSNEFSLPTDLLGLTTLTFDMDSVGVEIGGQLSKSCNKVRRILKELGRKTPYTEKFDQAAAVCLREIGGKREICLVKTDSDRWIFPKDFCYRSEDPWITAERAAYELAGCRGEIAKQPLLNFKHRKIGSYSEIIIGVYVLYVEESKSQLPFMGEAIWIELSEAEKFFSIGRDIQYLREIMSVIDQVFSDQDAYGLDG